MLPDETQSLPIDLSLPNYMAKSLNSNSGLRQMALIEDSTGLALSRKALGAAIGRVSAHLVRNGLTTGDVVALGCDNGYEMVAAYHGILAVGGIVLSIDPLASEAEWEHAFADLTVQHAVVDRQVWQKLRSLHVANQVVDIVTIGPDPHGGKADAHQTLWGDLLRPTRPLKVAPPSAPIPPEQPALIMYSSGTEGSPKRVVLTHRNLTVNLAQINRLHRLNPTDVVLGVTPFRHIYGMQMAMNAALLAGSTLVVASHPFSAAHLLDVVERRRVTVAYLVPSIVTEVTRLPAICDHDVSSLRMIFSGGSPLSASFTEKCAGLTGAVVVQGYGMTEAGCICITPDNDVGPAGSVGVPLPGTDLRIVDVNTGEEAVPGAEGEILVRGPQVSLQSLDHEAAGSTARSNPDGWLRTGDLARRAATGHITITGRRKQLIKYKSYQVGPTELEAVLLTHPAVRDAAVVGVPHDVAGEVPKAYVVLGSQEPLESVLSYVAARVTPYKRIRLIDQVEAIPRSATGKLNVDALCGIDILRSAALTPDINKGGSETDAQAEPLVKLITRDFMQDPYPALRSLRESHAAAPIVANGFRMWVITRYDDVRRILRDRSYEKDFVKNARELTARSMVRPDRAARLPRRLRCGMLDRDGTDHRRLRDLLSNDFLPERVVELEPMIEAATDDLLDGLSAHESADLVAEFARPLSATVISELLGVPAEERAEFPLWENSIFTGTSPDEIYQAGRWMDRFCREMIALKRVEPAEDIFTKLVRAADAGALDEDELASTFANLLIGGLEPSTVIASGVLTLLRHPSQLALLVDNPKLLPVCVEEVLRYESPFRLMAPRYADKPLHLEGGTVPAGELVTACPAAANRDPRRFSDPETFDICRPAQPHLSFGQGPHYCLGVHLGRLEVAVALNRFLSRFPAARLAIPFAEVKWRPGAFMRRLASLPVHLGPPET
jgi:acyl-CoA synthetase (AMP-forming)/AMP-acid ligase II/cytochrome P450